jgi:predicted Zn finger-like uncharacterized protein
MPIRTICPNCQAKYNLPDAMSGKKVRCVKCNSVMVAAPAEPALLEAVEVADEPIPPIAKKAKVRADRDDREDDASEAPPMVEAIREDEEDFAEERPRERKGKKKSRKRSQNTDEVARVAFFQRAILLCLLGNLIAGILRVFLPPDVGALFWFALIPVGLASTIFVVFLAKELLGAVAGIILGVLTLIPGIGFIVLLVVNQMATRRLKSSGVKVGFLGASVPSGSPSPIGLTLPMIGGALTVIVLGGMGVGYFVFADVGGWPTFSEHVEKATDPDKVVILHISGLSDPYTAEAIMGKLRELGDNPARTRSISTQHAGKMTARLEPVEDPRAAAQRVTFGTVKRVFGRTITIEATKLEGVPAEGDELGKAFYELKSPMVHKQREALNRLKAMQPNDRRDEVVKELTRILGEKNRFDHGDAAEALVVWAGKDKAVPVLIESLPQHNFIYRKAVIPVLASTKDPRTIEPIVQLLDEFVISSEVAKALKEIGPKAAPAVAKRLSSKDRAKVESACELLKDIGTPENIPELEKIAQNRRDRALALQASNAIKAIKARQ